MDKYQDMLTKCATNPEWAAEKIIRLEERVHALQSQIDKNSRNSSKPPSSDVFNKPKPKSLRTKTGKSPGGQEGHQGHTLHQVEEPDEIETHRVTECHDCGGGLDDVLPSHHHIRQVFDIPPVEIHVTEHRSEVKVCPNCQTKNHASFPEQVKAPVQYGPRLRAWCVYLHHYQLLPYDRTRELMNDLFNQPVSRATIVEAERDFFNGLSPIEEQIVGQLLAQPVAYFDETGIQVEGKKQWLHSASTDSLTYYTVHEKRGQEGIDAAGILSNYTGTAMHDAWQPYFKYENCRHVLCHAHHLRELTGIYEQHGQVWAKDMITLLSEMKEAVDAMGILDTKTLLTFKWQYDDLIEAGLAEDKRLNPPLPKPKGKRGRAKQSPAKNLLDRLQKYRFEALLFISEPNIPFDNNQAERDIRMVKVQQKVSGTFRSQSGAKRFCRIRGFVSTMKKQSLSVIESLNSVLKGDPFPL
jgi:transposase